MRETTNQRMIETLRWMLESEKRKLYAAEQVHHAPKRLILSYREAIEALQRAINALEDKEKHKIPDRLWIDLNF